MPGLSISTTLLAVDYSHPGVERLLAADRQPDGVVFELMAWEDNSRDWAAPMVESLSHQSRQKYAAIKQLESISNDNVDIHVCGTYANVKGLGDGDFLPFIDVSPNAPAQLADYKNLGFEHIVLEKPDGVD